MNRSYIPTAMWEEDDGLGVIGYMCLVDYDCELGGNSSGNVVYPCIESLKKHRRCVDGCGIVEVRVKATRVVQEPQEVWEDE